MPTISRVQTHLFRVPLKTPVVLSFGTMLARWALLVSIEDEDGHIGWGEVWCNFPDCGAMHREKLIHQIFIPLLTGVTFQRPEELSSMLRAKTRILKIQTAEIGPIEQCIAGLDCALWDLYARQQETPLFRLLGGKSQQVKTYASGINPGGVGDTIQAVRGQGYRRFKVKVGFGHDADLKTLTEARSAAGPLELACDANQAWELSEALLHITAFESFGLSWIEEPLSADRPLEDWQAITEGTSIRIAVGENLNNDDQFNSIMMKSGVRVIQPDLAKWGGITGCRRVATAAQAHQINYYPHYLGAAVGLIASAHLLAATNPEGLLEVDVNENPLRTSLLDQSFTHRDGTLDLTDLPGLGFTPDLDLIERYRVRA